MAAPTALANAQNLGLKLGAQAPAANLWDPTYATQGNPVDRQAKGLQQQDFVQQKVFDPQYRSALRFALDSNAPERLAQKAEATAGQTSAAVQDQYARTMARSGSLQSPEATAQANKDFGLQAALNKADAANQARNSTWDFQTDQLGDLTNMGIKVGRNALGLSADAASSYQTRMNQEREAKAAEAAGKSQMIGMGASLAVSAAMLTAAVVA